MKNKKSSKRHQWNGRIFSKIKMLSLKGVFLILGFVFVNVFSYGDGVVSYNVSKETLIDLGIPFTEVPELAESLPHRLTVSEGYNHNCSLEEGQVYCWGLNSEGPIGDGTKRDRSAPVLVSSGGGFENQKVTQLAIGNFYNCAIENDQLYCWGSNLNGYLGDGTRISRLIPTLVSSGDGFENQKVTQVSSGGYHTCAIENGQLYCWGSNDYGQIGDGTKDTRLTPTLVSSGGGFENQKVTQVSLGTNHTCAIENDQLFCWGGNKFFQLGDGTNTHHSIPALVSSSGAFKNQKVTQVLLDFHLSCAKENDQLFCWGWY